MPACSSPQALSKRSRSATHGTSRGVTVLPAVHPLRQYSEYIQNACSASPLAAQCAFEQPLATLLLGEIEQVR